jgi:predicted nucleic acid-binding Zn ribbon protein
MRYVYRCVVCMNEKEVEHSMKECDTHKEICECGCSMERAITGGQGFQLQGNTWSKDGYKSHGCLNPPQREDRKR